MVKAQVKATGSAMATAFGKQKEFAMVMTIINTAQGISQALAAFAPPISFVMAALVAAAGAAELATISSAKLAPNNYWFYFRRERYSVKD